MAYPAAFLLGMATAILMPAGTAGMALMVAGTLIGAVLGAIGILTGVLGVMIRGIGAGVGVIHGADLGAGTVLGVLMAHMVRGVLGVHGVRGTIGIGGVIMATGHGTAAALSSLFATTKNTLARIIALQPMAPLRFIEALAATMMAAHTVIRSTELAKVRAATNGSALLTSLLHVNSDLRAATTTAAVIMAEARRVVRLAVAATRAALVTIVQLQSRDNYFSSASLLRLHYEKIYNALNINTLRS